uniref:MIP07988p n=1 Tax=Drosophila melanogaster TaxID=7227 RepID=C0PVA2_DROME|nr:MIP08553p [Drosophila melanogaster]ACN91306.1 MIP07988p [Drosophila melanogaster]
MRSFPRRSNSSFLGILEPMRTMGRHRQPQANGRHPAASQ